MKKFINILMTSLIFLGAAYYMAGSYLKNKDGQFAQSFNQYNLLAHHGPKYIQIDYDNADQEADGSYTYYTDGYDRQGKWHDISFNSSDNFKDGQLLKLDTKGSYIKDYKKIGADDMPYKVYREFH